jgi:thioredoxin reductase
MATKVGTSAEVGHDPVVDDLWDCIIVGGGAAGLSAALVLGRARQRTLLIDAGGQSNLPAEGVGGLLGHDGQSPTALYAAAHRELAAYPTVAVRQGEVVSGSRFEGRIDFRLLDGSQCRARRVLLATGMDYERPAVAGVDVRWGRSVFHCPFCHGWEVRDRALGVLDSGQSGAHRALLLREWSSSVTVYSNGPADLDDVDARRLRTAGVIVDDRHVVKLCGPGTSLTAVRFADRTERICDGLLVPVTLKQRSPLAAQLGVELADPGPVAFDAVRVDATNRTSVPEVYAAGDTTTMPSVANAIASGSVAAAMIVHDLVAEAHGLARAA